jgi:alanine racemase
MTHLAKADVLDSSMTDEQLRLFKASIPVGVVTSIANSAAILAHPLTHGDWVRPGLMLYGVSPFADCSAHRLNLKPVMTVKAPVLAIKGIQAGMGVGYGQAWIAPEDTRIAIVGMGYGDGYPREAQGAVVEIAAKFYPVIGRVSMDLLAIEIGDAPVQLGESVCFWGPSNPIEILSKTVDTIPYTLLTRVSKRVEFCEIEDE